MLTQSGARWIRLSGKILDAELIGRGLRCANSEHDTLPLLHLCKNTHPTPPSRAFYTRMKKNGQPLRRRHIMDYALAAMSQMELYCEAHPGSPSAVRRPKLFVRGDLWIALLGPSVEEGIVGIGSTVTAALRAFDAQYLAGLRPRRKTTNAHRAAQTASPVPAV